MTSTLAMIGDAFAGGFGAMAAIVLIGGAVLLRWQRNRLQFALMQTALEKGVTAIPGSPPLWLISLRQGVSTLVLGIALAMVGMVVNGASSQVPMPVMTGATTQPLAGVNERPPMDSMMPEDGPPPPQEGRRGDFYPPDRQGPPPRAGMPGREGPPGAPPRPNPELERWHRAQDHKAVAMVAGAAGFVLMLLGLVRIVFAFAEKKFAVKAVA